MERRSNSAGNESLAVVIRQFSPTRIERELLARAFEVVVTSPVGRREPSASVPGGENLPCVASDHVTAQAKPTLKRSVA
jgi:hypothetical protein